MAVPIKIPDIGTTLDTVIIHRWLVAEGAEIVRGQPIVEVEADKAVMALESVAAGVLLKTIAKEGAEVAIGSIIAFVGHATESVLEISVDEPVVQAPAPTPPASPPREVSRPRVSPILRNLAKQKGVDLDQVVGTGIDGTILRQDIIAAAEKQNAAR